jgi:phosphoserine phosphatase RsbU/P
MLSFLFAAEEGSGEIRNWRPGYAGRANGLRSGRMEAIDPRYTVGQILHAIHQDQLYLFLGSAFITVGVVAAAFSLLRRKLDPLLLWLALFAVLYGTRLWLLTDMVRLELPHTPLVRNFSLAISYLIPLPAFLFFEAAGFLGGWAKISRYAAIVIFFGLFIGTMVLGPLDIFELVNSIIVVAATLVLVARSILRKQATSDFIVIRRGLIVFAAFVVYDNLSSAIGHFHRIEQYGFAFFLGCLGYVAARQTVERDAQLAAIQKELEVARRIQLSILPSAFPASTSFRVAARYEPMTSVAGDFYDFLLGNDQQAGLLIADVSGHGVPAALIASMVKMAATSQRDLVADPAGLLSGMNAALCGNTQQQFVTAAYVHLDSQTGEIRYSAAAHPPMLVLRRGEVTAVEENGLMLAAFSFATYLNAVSSLEPGDRILLYTDGIVEASNAEREEYGTDRLRALLRQCAGLSHHETADKIMSAVQGWAVDQEDDLTVLVCDYARGIA